MSEFRAPVVEVGPIEKHPNADCLGIAKVFDYPVIVRLGDFQPSDKAIYVPVDAVVPDDDPRWAFLGGHNRIKAKRLRGVFSMGLLVPAPPELELGQDATELLRLARWEPVEPIGQGENEKDPGFFPVYTDIEGLRRWPGVLAEGEEVVITEKLHGACARFAFHRGRFWVGSHTKFKVLGGDDIWNKAAQRYGLEAILRTMPGVAIYGEVYGQVQDLRYGAGKGEVRLALFDTMNLGGRCYHGVAEFQSVAQALDLPTVPVLYRGPWAVSLRQLAEGQSTMPGAEHVREGMVVRPIVERWNDQVGRVILKLHGEGYLTRKEK